MKSHIWAWVIAAVVVVGVVTWLLVQFPGQESLAVSVAQVVTALAGMIAAIAAWLAARQSADTADKAREALGLAKRPQPWGVNFIHRGIPGLGGGVGMVEDPDTLTVSIKLGGAWDAADFRAEFRVRGEIVAEDRRDLFRAKDEITLVWPDAGPRSREQPMTEAGFPYKLTLLYSDSDNLARWQLDYEADIGSLQGTGDQVVLKDPGEPQRIR